MPTETEWKEQSLLDPDIAYLIQKLKANEVVSYITLDNKGYYKQWSDGIQTGSGKRYSVSV
jgi:hypothetical protein